MERSVQTVLGKLNYRIAGEGLPIVLLHGLPFNGTLWKDQAAVLQSQYKVVIPDLPGSGMSELLPPGDRTVSVDGMAESVNDLLQQENIGCCVMIGHSMGGYVTLAFADRYPEKLKGFGLTHSTAFADTDERRAARDKNITVIRQQGAFEFLKGFLPPLFGETYTREHSPDVDSFIETLRDYPGSSLTYYFSALRDRPDRTHVLRNSNVPVLFIVGTEDRGAPMADLLQQVHLPAVSYVKILQGAGHVGMWESVQAFNAALSGFAEACR